MQKFKVWWPEYDQSQDDAKVVKGVDHEHAAKVWAEWYDVSSADYSIVDGEIAVLEVLREGEEVPVTVEVRGYHTPAYSAERREAA